VLSELRVRDLGVVEDLTLLLGPGMIAFTGETGAGKTLLVEALRLVLGGRATAGVTRAGAEEALLEARFVTGDAETVLSRALPDQGRSRAWVDGRMVPVAALAEAGGGLIDIHGQHDQQSLLTVAAQRRALDAYARSDLDPLARARRRLSEVESALAALGGDEQQRAREMDVLRYQLGEIDGARLEREEEDRLRVEHDRLADLSALREAAARALGALGGFGDVQESELGETLGAVELLARAAAALGGRPPFDDWESRLRAISTEAEDVRRDLRHVLDTWQDDPARLAEVLARQRLLADLRRKYGGTMGEVLAFADEARRRLGELETAEAAGRELDSERQTAAARVSTEERGLLATRRAAAPKLAAAAGTRLRGLAMPGARFEIDVADEGAGERVQFLLGANPGEPVQPLARVASGGELARAMLALRLEAMEGPLTLVFDEVDAGVGGKAALALAEALREVAVGRQVLVVTHLAQVAAFADRQIAVHKSTNKGRTTTDARVLSRDERVVELSRMLSGSPASSTARAHAEELLATAQEAVTATPSRRPRRSTTDRRAIV
jgi:DNA repair protein RecN (Recombination protein N)